MNKDIIKQGCLIDTIGAMINVLTHQGKQSLSLDEKALVSTLLKFFLADKVGIDAIRRVTPDDIELMDHDISDIRFIMSCLIVLPYQNGRVSHSKNKLVNDYAEALAMNSDAQSILTTLAKQRIAVSETSLLRDNRKALLEGQLAPRALDSWNYMREKGEDKTIALRYHTLKAYPRDSFGYALYSFYKDNQLPLPGEPYGVLNGLGLIDDMAYVLGNFKKNEEGRIYHAFFQAGFSKHYGFLFSLIGLMHYYLDSVMTVNQKKGVLNKPSMQTAYQRGQNMQLDLYDNWDYWKMFKLPLKEVREIIGCIN